MTDAYPRSPTIAHDEGELFVADHVERRHGVAGIAYPRMGNARIRVARRLDVHICIALGCRAQCRRLTTAVDRYTWFISTP
ncbi:hypothetical protein [Microbacterium sp.]|uniref:hypothetical protein n=1 Tax=Microbacterium sp. TaxID=51671 RepID=UPI003A90B428